MCYDRRLSFVPYIAEGPMTLKWNVPGTQKYNLEVGGP
jgi:hypothetical protein